jgi:hypothetical protein
LESFFARTRVASGENYTPERRRNGGSMKLAERARVGGIPPARALRVFHIRMAPRFALIPNQ